MVEVHGTILTELLVEGLAQYFHVPAPFQVLCDREGPIASSSDIRRTLQSLAPRLWLFDCRRMGSELRAQCHRRIEDLGLELGASKQRIADDGRAAKTALLTHANGAREPASPPTSPPSLLPWVTSWKEAKLGSPDSLRFGVAANPEMTNGRSQSQFTVPPPSFGDEARTPPRISSDAHVRQEPLEDGSQRAVDIPLGVGISRDNASTTELRRWRPEYPSTVVPYSDALQSVSTTAATGSTCDLRRSPDGPGFGLHADAVKQPGGVARAALEGFSSAYGSSSSSTTPPNGSSRQRQHLQQVQPHNDLSSGRTVEVVLRKTVEGQIFGFTNVPEVSVNGRCCLRISKVNSAGLLAAWNTLYPERSLNPGDRILSVNGVSEDLAEMRELLCGSSVRLTAEKYSYEEVVPASNLAIRDSFPVEQQQLVPVDARAERLQHQICKAEERMGQGSSLPSKSPSSWRQSPSPWQPHFRNDLLEKERRIEELERQLLLWQLSESKSGRAQMPEWRRPWQNGDDDGSNDGEKIMRRTPPAIATPTGRGANTLSDSPSREEQEFLRQQLQRKVNRLLAQEDSLGSVKVSAPVQIETGQTQAEKERSNLHQRIEEQTEEMATWKTLLRNMEQQMADLTQQRRANSARGDCEEALLIRFPSVPLPTPPNFESHLPVCLEHLGATKVADLSMHLRGDGDTVIEVRGPLPALDELCRLPLQELQVAGHRVGEVWRETLQIDPAGTGIQRPNGKASSQFYIGSPNSVQPASAAELEAAREAAHRQECELRECQSKAKQLAEQAERCQSSEQEWLDQVQRAEEEARQQAATISEIKAWKLQEQQAAAEAEERQRRKSLARTAERDADAQELRMLRQNWAAAMQELEAQHLQEQQLAIQAREECTNKVREIQELEKRALSNLQDAQQMKEHRKKALLCEDQVQSLQDELREQEAAQEQLRAQVLSNAAQSDSQRRLAEELEQARRSEAAAAEEMLLQQEHMLLLEESELEITAERDKRQIEMQYWQAEHSEDKQALERQRSEAAAAARSSQDAQQKLLRERDEEAAAKERLARESAEREQRIKDLEAEMKQMALQPKEEPELEEDLSAAVEAGPPDYVAVDIGDELDVRLGEEIAALGTGILRGETLTRTAASKYKLGDKKIFCKLIEGNIHVREKGNHIALEAWLQQMFAETPAGDEDDVMANMANPWAEHG